ncbi:MAG: signal peptide peptidase SppA [Candidatus Hydrogenedentota bacterium]|nr:MAG: signal peptide peptidase SppA [Candidatus Hydrogenedentota bacterium]
MTLLSFRKNLIFLAFLSSLLYAQSATDLLQLDSMVNSPNIPHESVATSDDTTALYYNPAGIGIHPLQFGFFYGNDFIDKLQDYTVLLNAFGIAFSTQWRNGQQGYSARRYTVGLGLGGNQTFSIGTSYSWYDSKVQLINNYTQWDIGFLLRPARWLSLGAVARGVNKPSPLNQQIREKWDFGIGFRPLAMFTQSGYSPRVLGIFADPDSFTFSVDSTWYLDTNLKKMLPRYTIEYIPVRGWTAYGGWDNFSNVFFGLKVSQNLMELTGQVKLPKEKGSFFSAGVMVSKERFITESETITRSLVIPLDIKYIETKQEGFLFLNENITFYEILAAIRQAAKDPQIASIILKGRSFSGGWGQAEELRSALTQFKLESGKAVYAFLESGGNKEYYIASVADVISMPPAGSLEVSGLKADTYYVKSLLDKLGIKAEFVHIGNYKTAPESFTRDNPSEYQKEQMLEILTDLSNEMKRAILFNRKTLTTEDLQKIQEKALFTASEAEKYHLIDKVQYWEDVKAMALQGKLLDIAWSVDLSTYIKTKFYDDTWGSKPVVAIVVLEGEIVDGDYSGPGLFSAHTIASERTAKLIRSLRDNPSVNAVVIRINSPGGSGLASDIIWKEIRLLKEEKPVVISIGDVAASGGYYIAMGGDDIFVNHNSITGSIGVFGGKFSLKGLYEWLGINKHTFKTGQKAAIFSEAEDFTPEEKALLQEHLKQFYALFIDRVSRNRTNLTREAVEQNAQGRVYTGHSAKQRGMVDHYGGLLIALDMAMVKAGVDPANVEIQMYPRNTALGGLLDGSSSMLLPNLVRQAIRIMSTSEKLKDDKILFLMPYELNIH